MLLYLKESRAFDFTGYERTTLVRRVRHRMDQVLIDEVKLTAVNRPGRAVLVREVCSSLRGRGDEPAGAILVMEQQSG